MMAQSYEIRLKGHLDASWSEWLGELTVIHLENGETLLRGRVTDQSALHGVLNRLGSIGNALIAVNPIDEGDTNRADEDKL
jgi:hypothetical protein